MREASEPRLGITPRFCISCGGRLAVRELKAGDPPRSVCTQCSYVQYADPKVAAGVICAERNRVILLRRAIEPSYGKWVFPGGFVDLGEAAADAARRETREEVCLDVRISGLLNVYSYPGHPVIVIVYEGEIVSGQLTAGDEALEVRSFAPAEIPWNELAFPSTRDALREYLARR